VVFVKRFCLLSILIFLSACGGGECPPLYNKVITSASGYKASTGQTETQELGRREYVWITAKNKTQASFWVTSRIYGPVNLHWVGDVLWIYNRDIGGYVYEVKPTGLVRHDPCKLKYFPADPMADDVKLCRKGKIFDSPGAETTESLDPLFRRIQ
jgi:hypothetical protein